MEFEERLQSPDLTLGRSELPLDPSYDCFLRQYNLQPWKTSRWVPNNCRMPWRNDEEVTIQCLIKEMS